MGENARRKRTREKVAARKRRASYVVRQVAPPGSLPLAAGGLLRVLAGYWPEAWLDLHTHGLYALHLGNGVMHIKVPVPPGLVVRTDAERVAAMVSNYASGGIKVVAAQQKRDPGRLPLALMHGADGQLVPVAVPG